MTKRSVVAVVLLVLFTGGLYGLLWYVNTKDEMNRAGAEIPTAWLLCIPFANLWWVWQWAGGVERVTGGRQTQASTFVLMFIYPVGFGVVQSALNLVADERGPGQLPMARVV